MIPNKAAELACGGVIFILYFMTITQLFQKVLHFYVDVVIPLLPSVINHES